MKTMKNLMGLVMAAIIMVVFNSCGKVADHESYEEGKAKLVIDEKPNPGPQPVLRDSIHWHFRGDSLVVICDSIKDDVIFKSDSTSIGFNLKVERRDDERQTASTRLEYPNLGFTFADAINKQNGKMEYVGSQTGSDDDGQSYTINLTSGKIMNWHGLNGVHFVLNGTKLNRFDNKELTPKANESTRVESTMKWEPELGVAGLKNPEGKTLVAKRETKHERYILKNAPEFIKYGDWKVWKETGNWNTVWHFECNEYWSNDSVAPKSKLATLKGSYSKIELSDKTVSNLVDYTHPVGTLVWGNWYDVESKDTGVTLREKKGTKKSLATNGFDADKFDTEFSVTMQEADVLFCDSLFHVESDEATLTNKRNIFVDEDSDRDGYQMVRFTDTELAQWAGQYDQKLDETCKLYLKVATPAELEKIEFNGTKIHADNKAKIDGIVIPVYDDGSKGGAISFKWSKAESWQWLKDSVIAEGVTFVNEETGNLTLKGSESKAEKTFATDNENITIKCNQYDADFQTTVKVDGQTKVTTWHATWYEDFRVIYEGKEVSLTKSSYSVKNANDKLTKDEARSNATSEVWGYSVEGIFSIDEDSRSAYGYGRITKAIEESVVKIYWDEASKGQSHTILASTRWATLIREYNTGKKTSQEYKHVYNRLSQSSSWEISAEEGSEKAANSMLLENATEENRADDFAHFSLKKFELGQFFDVPGAAQQHDKVTITESMGAYFEVKDQDGNPIKVYFEDPSYSFTNDVKALTVKSENDSETVYQHENVVNWNFGGATTTLSATGLIHVAKSQETPNFDIEVGSIFASVSRPSNRNASDITAYTYLLVSKDGKKCLPLGFYNGVITVDEKNGIVDYVSGMNSACYVKDQNKVVATRAYSDRGLGMMIWCGADGNPVDAASHITLQGAGFNDRGNDWINHTGKYAPRATKKGNVTVVTFEGTNVSYTFRGWNVQ